MQFLVFGAFAVILSVPDGGPPWPTVTSVWGSWAIVLGQFVAVGAAGAIFTHLVLRKLEYEKDWLRSAQNRLNQGGLITRVLIAAGYLVSIFLTDWTRIVRSWDWATRFWGLDEMILLLPFLLNVMVAWVSLFPADRAVRRVALELRLFAGMPSRPVWKLGRYLSYMFRQHVLVIALPMTPIVVAYDFSRRYADEIVKWTQIPWAHEAVVVVVAGVVFLFAPTLLALIWQTKPLPNGELRDRLEAMCRRVNLRYRRILIWETDGMVVNAAVMGLFRPVRYILLSDGLISMMDERKIEAVFGHEAGHVKHHHIPFYLLFAVLSMLMVGGVTELVRWGHQANPDLFGIATSELYDYLRIGAMGLVVLLWGAGFGIVSRRFEWQADLYGAWSVTPQPRDCVLNCRLHGDPEDPSRDTAPPPEQATTPRRTPLCATSARLFSNALQSIAEMNGIPLKANSWRHSSIRNRMNLLDKYAEDPGAIAALLRSVAWIKGFLLLGTVIGLVIAIWLYWPAQWPSWIPRQGG